MYNYQGMMTLLNTPSNYDLGPGNDHAQITFKALIFSPGAPGYGRPPAFGGFPGGNAPPGMGAPPGTGMA